MVTGLPVRRKNLPAAATVATLRLPGARRVTRGLRAWVAIFDAADAPDPEALAAAAGAGDVRFVPVTFDDVFLELLAPADAG